MRDVAPDPVLEDAEPDAEPDAAPAGPPTLRMAIAVLALLGVLLSGYLTAHRFGLLGTLACGAGGCDTVQASEYATFLGIPVPLIGLGGYLVVLGVALAGVAPGRLDDPRVGHALLALSGVAFAFTAYLTWLEAFVIHAWCRWCLGSAAIITLIFLASVAEVMRARAAARRAG